MNILDLNFGFGFSSYHCVNFCLEKFLKLRVVPFDKNRIILLGKILTEVEFIIYFLNHKIKALVDLRAFVLLAISISTVHNPIFLMFCFSKFK